MAVRGSFTNRQFERTFVLPGIQEFKWQYTADQMSYMLNNYPIYCEMGGLFGICSLLRTDTATGIRADEQKHSENSIPFEKRIKHYGENKIPPPELKSIWEHALDALGDTMLIMLCAAGLFSIVFNTIHEPAHGWIDGLAILFAVALVVGVTSINNYKQELSFQESVMSLKGARFSVIRNSIEGTCEQDDLLVGDIVKLSPGNMVPADGVLVTNTSVKVSEASITGETNEIEKTHASPFFISGSEVVNGSCYYLITAVGVLSAKGKLMTSMDVEREKTALQVRLDDVAEQVGYIGIGCAVIMFIALTVRFAVGLNSWGEFSDKWTQLVEFFIIGVTIIVVAVPEGLPLAVTVSLAYSLEKMKADANFVKELSACETMGNATAICSDKTGTLTQNRMTVVQSYIGGVVYPNIPEQEDLNDKIHQLLVESIVMNSDRRIAKEKMDFQILPEDWKWEGDGGETESALLSWISRYHQPEKPGDRDIMDLREDLRPRNVKYIPFSSVDKYSSVLMLHPDEADIQVASSKGKYRQYFKGAADRLLSKCTKAVAHDGSIQDIGSLDLPKCVKSNCNHNAMYGTERSKPKYCKFHGAAQFQNLEACIAAPGGIRCIRWAIMGEEGAKLPSYCNDPSHHPNGVHLCLLDSHPMKIMENFARSGLRTIVSAYCDNSQVSFVDGKINCIPGDNWVFVSLVGIKDPLRAQTKNAVKLCQKAGIILRMVTGDNIETATYIAKDCGIITSSKHIAMEGKDFRDSLFNQRAYKAKNGKDLPSFLSLVENLRVMARCQPEDKLELVQFLKEHDEIVGVTGDGSNDGPALKAAHVGLAMGIAGTDVSKAAAKIIIEDDNFNSIVRSVVWGRSVYDNIRKFLQFQLSVNVVALTISVVGAVSGKKEPLKPVQLLWVNLVMDTMGALALGTEYPKDSLLDRKPYSIDAPLISKIMWRNILGQAAVQIIILFIILYGGENLWNYEDQGKYSELVHYTFLFNTFVWLQFWNEIASRKVNLELNFFEGFFENTWFAGILIVTAFFQVLMVEAFGSFAGTTHQSASLWLWAIILGASMLPSGYILRFFPIDPTEGQIDLDSNKVFEGAPWLSEQDDKKYTSKGGSAHQDGGDQELQPVVTESKTKVQLAESFKPADSAKKAFLMPSMTFTKKESQADGESN